MSVVSGWQIGRRARTRTLAGGIGGAHERYPAGKEGTIVLIRAGDLANVDAAEPYVTLLFGPYEMVEFHGSDLELLASGRAQGEAFATSKTEPPR